MKKVMVLGHSMFCIRGMLIFCSKRAGEGDFLLVVVARDETVAKIKKQKPRNREQKRKRVLENSQLADKVILGNLNDKYAVIKKYRPDIICLGYDQKAFVDKLKNKLKQFELEKTKIKKLKPFHPEKYKSVLLV